MTAIGPASSVSFHFTLKLADGHIVDSTRNRPEPVRFKMGDGNLLAGFERKLIGLVAGDSRCFDILPEDGFGMPNPNNVQTFDRAQFDGMELSEGLVISFADAAKGELPGVVSQITTDKVVVDFNHPLAGKAMQFDVEIFAVE